MIDEEAELAALYSVPLDQFTAARNDLVARFVAEGSADAAARTKGLKKPSVSAWLVNQLARTREIDLARLLKAGEALEEAQRAVLSGKPAGFEKSRKEEDTAVRMLREAAKEMLPTASVAILDRVAQTLRAASSAAGRARLKGGRLTEDLEPAGFETFTAFQVSSTGSKAITKQPNRKRTLLEEKQQEVREKLKDALVETKQLEKVAKAAEAAARKAALAAEAAGKRAELVQAELKKIEDDLARLK